MTPAGCSMPAASEPACRRRRSPSSTAASRRSPSRKCRSTFRRRETRFGGRLVLSKVHWVRPELVAEITYLTWAEDGLLRHTVFIGLRDDKPPREVRRERPA